MPSRAEAERLQAGQGVIAGLVRDALADLVGSLDLSRPEASRDLLLQVVPTLVQQYGEDAATVAADWYDEQRAAARAPGRYRARIQRSPYLDAVDGTVRRASAGLFTQDSAAVLTALSGPVGKYVLAAGRQTIITSTDRDPAASGWQRVTRTGACDFCRMLAGRGGVYREATVHFASHDDCNCAAVPSWDPDAPEVDVAQYQASQRTTRMTPRQREQHNARIRAWIAEHL